jgi:hypothetical protein
MAITEFNLNRATPKCCTCGNDITNGEDESFCSQACYDQLPAVEEAYEMEDMHEIWEQEEEDAFVAAMTFEVWEHGYNPGFIGELDDAIPF